MGEVRGGVGGVGDGGAGVAAFQNQVLINWKEPADDPRLKGNFGDLKNKTISCDLGIYKNGGGGQWQGIHNSQDEFTHFKEDIGKMTRGEIISQLLVPYGNNLGGKGELCTKTFRGRTRRLFPSGPRRS